MDVKHAVLESTHKTVFDGYRQKMEGPAEATEDPAQGLNSINTDLVLPQASPGAHPIISNYDTYICLYYLCIRFRNDLEP